MGNLFDYLDWRGDLTFGNVPLGAIDTLAFSVISYVRLEAFVDASPFAEPVRLADAAKAYFAARGEGELSQNEVFLQRAAATARFGQVRIFAAEQQLDREHGIQFAAFSALLPGQTLFVCFEGTDNTLIGWQEDLRMSYECPVPAQLRAAAYLRSVAAAHPLRRIYVAGHSKGGNLAMYAALHAGDAVRYRVRGVYNHDGPGFCDNTLSSEAYVELRGQISTYLPQSSIVGVLLEHDDNYKILQSSAKGLAQHDPLTWQILGTDFVYATERTAFGQKTEAILDHFLNTLSPERKRLFAEALFTLLEATEQETISGITANKLQSIKNAWRGLQSLDPELREMLGDALDALTDSRRAVRRAQRRAARELLEEGERSS